MAKLTRSSFQLAYFFELDGIMGLKQQLIQSEHRVKAKEQVIGRLQDRLEQEAKRHEREMQRSREIFKKFRGREPRPASAVDSKTLEAYRGIHIKHIKIFKNHIIKTLHHQEPGTRFIAKAMLLLLLEPNM